MASQQDATEQGVPRSARTRKGGLFAFVFEGYAIDIAIGFLIGSVLLSFVNTLMGDLIVPLIPTFPLNGSDNPHVGAFLNSLIYYIVFLLIICFLVVLPLRALKAHYRARNP